MNDERLRKTLRDIAAATANATAGPRVEPDLRRAVRALAAGRRAQWWRAVAAAVFLVMLGLGLADLHDRPVAAAPEVRAVTPWYFSAGVPAVESGQLIRMDVPASTAARFGVLAADPVQADLIIGDDGLTRAIRFVQ